MNISKAIGNALSRVHKIIDKNGANIVKSVDIARQDRELLIKTNWLQEIIKGWYLLTKPDIVSGDSSIWYANFWDFLNLYLTDRFGEDYCLSAENSLELHTQTTIVPRQVIVIVSRGGSGAPQLLPFDTSILFYADPGNIPENRVKINGIQVMSLSYALCKVTPTFFAKNSQEAKIALKLVRDPSELSRVILENNFLRAASRIIGSYHFLKNEKMATVIEKDLEASGMSVISENPFKTDESYYLEGKISSPYAMRIVNLWQNFRQDVIDLFPASPELSKNRDVYLKHIEDIYTQDAYNSLSIEGYQVTPQLIDRVKNNEWDPELATEDSIEKNALAARGYLEAFKAVEKSVERVLKGEHAGTVVRDDLKTWYRFLFSPFAQVGIISNSQLIGYRTSQVFIRNSRHVPPPKESLLDSMDTLFDCMINEKNPAVRAVLGHYFFVFIHPYMDGNGRMARFLMNVMFASGGFPWTIIHVKNRNKYMSALETADVDRDIKQFVKFIISEMKLGGEYVS